MIDIERVECGHEFHSCRCDLLVDHDPPCMCPCGGSWTVSQDGCDVVAFPSIMNVGPVQPKPIDEEPT